MEAVYLLRIYPITQQLAEIFSLKIMQIMVEPYLLIIQT